MLPLMSMRNWSVLFSISSTSKWLFQVRSVNLALVSLKFYMLQPMSTSYLHLPSVLKGLTEKYWPRVVVVWTECSKVHRNNKYYIANGSGLVIKFASFWKQQRYTAYDSFHEAVCMAKSWPRKNQSDAQIYL